MADAYADACFIVAAMDLPLHGIVQGDPTFGALYCSPALPQCIGAKERTFDVDLVNNTTGLPPGDGKVDASGTHMINLTSPATGRDNLRQAEADLIQFTKSIRALRSPRAPRPRRPGGRGPDAHQLHRPVARRHRRRVAYPLHERPAHRHAGRTGGVITKLLLDSQTFGPRIKAGVTAQLAENSFAYNLFFRDFQAVIDSGDPINHIKDAVTMHRFT